MPKRTESHITGDIAASRVMQIFSECGWACESIEKDYGEDLLVQTSHDGDVDHFKIFIQVKGTKNIERFKSKKHGYSISVSFDHALKWIRSLDLVVVVLYDIKKDYGLFSIPKWFIDQWDLYMLENKKSRLIFPEELAFNRKSAEKLRWIAWIDYYTTLLNNAVNHDAKFLGQEMDVLEIDKEIRKRIALITFDILRDLNVIGENRIDPIFVKYYKNALRNISKDMTKDSLSIKNQTASLLAFMGKLNDLAPGVGATAVIMEECSIACLQWIASLSETNPDEWHKICRMLEKI